jgi:DNA-binding phage protein
MAKARKKRKTANFDIGAILTKAEQVAALSGVLMAVRDKRFEIDQSSVVLSDVQRKQLAREYDIARDAYYKGLTDLVDSRELGVATLLEEINTQRTTVQRQLVTQNNVVNVLGVIASLVGLASKLVLLGAL